MRLSLIGTSLAICAGLLVTMPATAHAEERIGLNPDTLNLPPHEDGRGSTIEDDTVPPDTPRNGEPTHDLMLEQSDPICNPEGGGTYTITTTPWTQYWALNAEGTHYIKGELVYGEPYTDTYPATDEMCPTPVKTKAWVTPPPPPADPTPTETKPESESKTEPEVAEPRVPIDTQTPMAPTDDELVLAETGLSHGAKLWVVAGFLMATGAAALVINHQRKKDEQ